MPEYRITYSIERRDDSADFTEIGFGSSVGAATVDDALYFVQSEVQNRGWETGDGMPDPAEVDQ